MAEGPILQPDRIVLPDPEHPLWQENKEQITKTIQANIESFWNTETQQLTPYGLEQSLHEGLEAEKKFFNLVMESIDRLTLDSRSERLVLFDLDQTLVQNKYLSDYEETGIWEYECLIRPTAEIIMNHLKNIGVEMGVLSNRSISVLEENLQNPGRLGTLKQHISEKFILSSREGPDLLSPRWETLLKFNITADGNLMPEVLKDEIVDAQKCAEILLQVRAEPKGQDRMMTNARKLNVLFMAARSFKDKAVLVIDDYKFPLALDPKKHFYGGYVPPDAAYNI